MKGVSVIASLLMIALIVVGMFTRQQVDERRLIERQKDSLQAAFVKKQLQFDSLQATYQVLDTTKKNLERKLTSLNGQFNSITYRYEKKERAILTASDSELVRILSAQHIPEGF